MKKLQGWELPRVEIKKGKHSMDVPNNALFLLRNLFYEVGYTGKHVVEVELGPKIEASNTTPVFTVGQITDRKSIELNVKSNGNDSRFLFYVFPTGELNLFNLHINLKRAVNTFNIENAPNFKGESEETNFSSHYNHKSSLLKVSLADLVFKDLQKKLKENPPPTHKGSSKPYKKFESRKVIEPPALTQVEEIKDVEPLAPIQVEEIKVEPVQTLESKMEEIPAYSQEEIKQNISVVELFEDEELLNVILELLYEKSHDGLITRANLIHTIEKQKLGCEPENVEAFLFRKKYIKRQSSTRGTFKFKYTPPKKPNLHPKDEIEEELEMDIDFIGRLKQEADKYFSAIENSNSIDDKINVLRCSITNLEKEKEIMLGHTLQYKDSAEKFLKLKKIFMS